MRRAGRLLYEAEGLGRLDEPNRRRRVFPIRENTRPLFSLSRDTLATTLRPEPLANQPPLTQAYIFRGTPAQVAPTLGARPILLRAGAMMLSLAVHCHGSRSPPPLSRALVSAIAPSSCQPARKKKGLSARRRCGWGWMIRGATSARGLTSGSWE